MRVATPQGSATLRDTRRNGFAHRSIKIEQAPAFANFDAARMRSGLPRIEAPACTEAFAAMRE